MALEFDSEVWSPFPGLRARAIQKDGRFFSLEIWRLEGNEWRYVAIRDSDILHSAGPIHPPGVEHESE